MFLQPPNSCSGTGKAGIRSAAIQAGLLWDEGDDRLTFITEPEAALTYCCETERLDLALQDIVLTVNCGEATVDLITHQVVSESPLTFTAVTDPTGDGCGSTAISRNFKNAVGAKIKRANLEKTDPAAAASIYRKCMTDFVNRLKAEITYGHDTWEVEVGTEYDHPEADITDGYMTFHYKEINSCFEPVLNRILQLIEEQISIIGSRNPRLKYIFVIGDFDVFDYLMDQIQEGVPARLRHCVIAPIDPCAPISQGAVKWGLTATPKPARTARQHILISKLRTFSPGVHPEEYKVLGCPGPDGSWWLGDVLCNHTAHTLVNKGATLGDGESWTVTFYQLEGSHATLRYEEALYLCDDELCPLYTTDPRPSPLPFLSALPRI